MARLALALLALSLSTDALNIMQAQEGPVHTKNAQDIELTKGQSTEEGWGGFGKRHHHHKKPAAPKKDADGNVIGGSPSNVDGAPAGDRGSILDPDSSEAPHIDDPAPKWTPPFNLTNGACKPNPQSRYIMEITNVAHGSYYIGKMGFGTPAQELNMLLDTGSDEIVVKGKDCRGCQGHAYDHNASSTYEINQPEGDPEAGKEEVSYGSGDVWGQHVFDTISTGPLKGPHMDLLEVRETSIQEFADTAPTALEVVAGMAPGLPEYVGQRMASHMEVRRFSECLPTNADENGFFVVNDDNPKEKGFAGPFMSMGNYYWAVNVGGMRFDWTPSQKSAGVPGSEKFTPLSKKKFTMLVDTGTTLLSMPKKVMDELDKALKTIGSDCSKMDQLPSLAFEIDGVTHSLPPSTYIAEESSDQGYAEKKQAARINSMGLKEKDSEESEEFQRMRKLKNLYYREKKFINSKTGAECHLLFTEPVTMNSTLGELGILGMPLFRNYMVTFDFCHRQIWTKPHFGDCAKVVGAHPSNKDGCADNDVIWCFFEHLGEWFKSLFEGFGSIFTQESATRTGPRLKYIPGTDRLSAGARWLLSQTGVDGAGLVEL